MELAIDRRNGNAMIAVKSVELLGRPTSNDTDLRALIDKPRQAVRHYFLRYEADEHRHSQLLKS